MQIEKDSRQVPKVRDYMANSKYCDILYCYFQTISVWDNTVGHPRTFSKKEKNFSKIGAILGQSRQTISKKFKNLLDLGLIKETEDNYELIILEEDLASLIPIETLRVLVNTMNDNTISIYVYLLNRYYATISGGQQEFLFTKEQLKNIVGLSITTRSNDYIVDDILAILQKLNLLQFESRDVIDKNTGDTKTYLYITKMSNKII